MARKRKPNFIRLTGMILPRTDQPDAQGDIIDVDGVTWPETVPVKWNFGAEAIGYIDLDHAPTGVMGRAKVVRNPLNPKYRDMAFAIEARVDEREGPRITRSTITGVSLVRAQDAVTPGTGVRVDHRKE